MTNQQNFNMSTLPKLLREGRPVIQLGLDNTLYRLQPLRHYRAQVEEDFEKLCVWRMVPGNQHIGFETKDFPGWSVLALPPESSIKLVHFPGKGSQKKGRTFNSDLSRGTYYLLGHTSRDTHRLKNDDVPTFLRRAYTAGSNWEDAEKILSFAFDVIGHDDIIWRNPDKQGTPGLYHAKTAKEVLRVLSQPGRYYGPDGLYQETWKALERVVDVCAVGGGHREYTPGNPAIRVVDDKRLRQHIFRWMDHHGISRPKTKVEEAIEAIRSVAT